MMEIANVGVVFADPLTDGVGVATLVTAGAVVVAVTTGTIAAASSGELLVFLQASASPRWARMSVRTHDMPKGYIVLRDGQAAGEIRAGSVKPIARRRGTMI